MPSPLDQRVDDILDPNQISSLVVRDDLPSLALVNKVGVPRRVFPTFMAYPQSFAFHNWGSGMVWDANTKTHQWLSLGAQRSTSMEEEIHVMVGEAERILQFEQHVMEELQAQQFYNPSASSPPVWWLHHHILVVMKKCQSLVLALRLGA